LAQTLHVSRARIGEYIAAGASFDLRDAREWIVASLDPRVGCVAIAHARRWLAQRKPDLLTDGEVAARRADREPMSGEYTYSNITG
jgi:hypothetical protein